MRLKQYIKEARVKTSNADVFLSDFAPVFAYIPKKGLIWSVFNRSTELWEIYKNDKRIRSIKSAFKNGKGITHMMILDEFNLYYDYHDSSIRGRIKPDGKVIYIHDLDIRDHEEFIEKRWDYYVNKAVNAVYKYMENFIN